MALPQVIFGDFSYVGFVGFDGFVFARHLEWNLT
jgi:hypothetical protein